MIHYILETQDGQVVQRGRCHTQEEIPVVADTVLHIITPDDERQPEHTLAPTYRAERSMDYPPLGDQLAVIWQELANLSESGGIHLMPATRDMISRIAEVKARYPKS